MTNDERKKKIVDTMRPILKGTRVSCNEDSVCEHCIFPCEVDRITDRLADAFIAAGIGDVKTVQKIADSATAMAVFEAAKAEHRAEVAERALDKACYYLSLWMSCWNMFHSHFCPEDSKGLSCVDCRKKWLIKQAEKELAEEGK